MYNLLLRHLAIQPKINDDLSSHKYLLFDGKYLFGRKYSLCILFDAKTSKPIDGIVFKSESYKYIYPWLLKLKLRGLDPVAVTTDGLYTAIRAFKDVFPGIATQRCLFHIELQVSMWLRFKPKLEVAKQLKALMPMLRSLYSNQQAVKFKKSYLILRDHYAKDISLLDRKSPVQDDIAKCFVLIDKALEYMFYFIDDSQVARTTSALEGYNKKIQDIRGFRHNGLTQEHLIQFIQHKIHNDSSFKK